jgi:hypothetical protein
MLASHPFVSWRGVIVTVGTLIDKARNDLLWNALKSDAEVALWVDDDMGWGDGAVSNVIAMIQAVTHEETDICGTNYPTRGGQPTTHDVEGLPVRLDDEVPFRKVSRVGTGLMALSLDWVRRAWPLGSSVGPWFESYISFDPENMKGFHLYGEDHRFCDEAVAKGANIACRGGIHASNGDTKHPLAQQEPLRRPGGGAG